MSCRRLILLGSTGSIGRSTLAVVDHLRTLGRRFEIVGLAAGGRTHDVFAQAERFGVRHVGISSPNGATAPRGVTLHVGDDAATRLVEQVAQPGDLVVGAIVGAAGLSPTIAAIERGCDIALANKETLVAAGSLVMPLARKRGVAILPVDSEHSAIFQCLRSASNDQAVPREVRRLVITASGGPFRTWDAARMRDATVEEALNHPTWRMGPKVTIDSASMMNKALEMIEAHWLFDIDEPRIEPLIHPQSIVHSLVEFVDGSTIAQLSPPDMKLPIQHALTYPDRVGGCSPTIDWAAMRRLDFEPVDVEKFPAVRLARRALGDGGTSGAILNAANEVAVQAFIDGRVRFGAIPEIVEQAMDAVAARPVNALADVRDADARAREAALAFAASMAAAR